MRLRHFVRETHSHTLFPSLEPFSSVSFFPPSCPRFFALVRRLLCSLFLSLSLRFFVSVSSFPFLIFNPCPCASVPFYSPAFFLNRASFDVSLFFAFSLFVAVTKLLSRPCPPLFSQSCFFSLSPSRRSLLVFSSLSPPFAQSREREGGPCVHSSCFLLSLSFSPPFLSD